MLREQVQFVIADRSDLGVARRSAAELAAELGFGPVVAGKLALTITEAATNILKHAGRGRLLLRPLSRCDINGVEVLALDQGPGISNVAASLCDGHSTAGGLGSGLGALVRLSDAFDIYSRAGLGTGLRLEIWAKPLPERRESVEVGAVSLPAPGASVAGDTWVLQMHDACVTLLVADGLGHGVDARAAADLAARTLATGIKTRPAEIIQACHDALAHTRGAAVAVARIAPADQFGSFAGVGNVACYMDVQGERRQLLSQNGILGHAQHGFQELEFAFPRGALLVLHTDGLENRWNLRNYPGLSVRHPGLIAGILYRDYDRGRDDVTIVVLRNGHGSLQEGS